MDLAIVRTGTANIASVVAAFERLGCRVRPTEGIADVREAERLVLPGVGTFGAAMERLNALGLRGPLKRRIEEGRPTLAICLGMQLLCAASQESPDVEGLGVVPGMLERFPDSVRVPQLGWNRIHAHPSCSILADGYVYFANSYRLEAAPVGWKAALCDHGGEFVAAIERGRVVACQFHPELSGEFGRGMIERWLW